MRVRKNVICFLLSIAFLFGNSQAVNAAGASFETITFKDDEGKIIAVFIPDDQIIQARYSSNIDWSVEGYHTVHGENQYTLADGDKININISIDPSGKSSTLGLWDVTNKKYIFTDDGTSTTGWNGTLKIVGEKAVLSLAIRNNTGSTVKYKGSYSL